MRKYMYLSILVTLLYPSQQVLAKNVDLKYLEKKIEIQHGPRYSSLRLGEKHVNITMFGTGIPELFLGSPGLQDALRFREYRRIAFGTGIASLGVMLMSSGYIAVTATSTTSVFTDGLLLVSTTTAIGFWALFITALTYRVRSNHYLRSAIRTHNFHLHKKLLSQQRQKLSQQHRKLRPPKPTRSVLLAEVNL